MTIDVSKLPIKIEIGYEASATASDVIATAPGATGGTITISDNSIVVANVRLYKTNQEVQIKSGDTIILEVATGEAALYYRQYATLDGFTVKIGDEVVNKDDVVTFGDEINDTRDTTVTDNEDATEMDTNEDAGSEDETPSEEGTEEPTE